LRERVFEVPWTITRQKAKGQRGKNNRREERERGVHFMGQGGSATGKFRVKKTGKRGAWRE